MNAQKHLTKKRKNPRRFFTPCQGNSSIRFAILDTNMDRISEIEFSRNTYEGATSLAADASPNILSDICITHPTALYRTIMGNLSHRTQLLVFLQ